MAILPSHFVWQRGRSELHSGAQRRYGEKPFTLPRGRTASRVPCALCNRISTVDQLVGPSLLPKISPVHSPELPDPYTPTLALEVTPPKAEATCKRATETEIQPQRLSRRFAEEVPSKCFVQENVPFLNDLKNVVLILKVQYYVICQIFTFYPTLLWSSLVQLLIQKPL